MNKKIFRSAFFTVLLVLAATIALILGVLYHFFEKQIQTELKNEADFLSQAVEKSGEDFFDGFESGDNRVTLIDAEGNVLYDSRADVESMDNHAQRPEIMEAGEQGFGMSVRYSSTLTVKTVNCAVRLSDGRILRVSTEQYTVGAILLGMFQPLAIILLVALALTAVLSSKVSGAIVEPINTLDLENPEKNDTYEELAPLLTKIARQKKMIERQLSDARKKQNEFGLITENMSEGFLTIDQDASLLTYNPAACRLLNITPPAEGNVLVYCRTKDFREAISEALDGRKAERTMVQNEHSYSLIANPVFENEKVIGAVVIILDITEQEERETLRREFTANVSHELKTPLTSISGFAELMKEGGTAADTVVDFSQSIYEEAQRLIALVNDIIMISELDGRSIPYQEEEVDLYELSEQILGRLKVQAEKRNIALNLFGEKTTIRGVYRILDEMIYNLCDNAVKYNRENGTVDVIINHAKNHVSVVVRDNGIGIPAAHQGRIFERFYRVDKSHSRKVGGTGLGLAIVKHGAIYHNAQIELKSREGEGTVVTLTFISYHMT